MRLHSWLVWIQLLVPGASATLDLFVQVQYWGPMTRTTDGENRRGLVDANEPLRFIPQTPVSTHEVFVGGQCYQPRYGIFLRRSNAFILGTLADGTICRQDFPFCKDDLIFSANATSDCADVWQSDQLYFVDEYQSIRMIHFEDWCISATEDIPSGDMYSIPIVRLQYCGDDGGFPSDFIADPNLCRPHSANYGFYDEEGYWQMPSSRWYCSGGIPVQEDFLNPDCTQVVPARDVAPCGINGVSNTCPQASANNCSDPDVLVQCDTVTALCKDFYGLSGVSTLAPTSPPVSNESSSQSERPDSKSSGSHDGYISGLLQLHIALCFVCFTLVYN